MKKKEKRNNKKLIIVIAIVLLLSALGLTLAYFVGQIGSGATANINVTTATVDTLTFTTGADITIGPVTQQNFASGQPNQFGSTTATATLRANNTTNTANETYNLYVNITNNTFKKTTEDAELILTITNPAGTVVNSLNGLTYTTVKGVSGFDVTEKSGLITIANNYAISVPNASNNPKTDTWNITLTFVNLDADQSANAGASFSAQAIIQKEAMASTFTGTIYRYSTETISNGQSIARETGQKYCDIETSSGEQYDCFDTETLCNQFLVDNNYTETDTCQLREVTTGLSSYETNVANISNDFYLQHEVTNNIVQTSEVCLKYNNRTFCMGPNYWEGTIGVNDAAVGTETMNKLKTAMEAALGTSADSCSSSSVDANCNFGSFYCRASSNGDVYCNDDSTDCGVYSVGDSYCFQ